MNTMCIKNIETTWKRSGRLLVHSTAFLTALACLAGEADTSKPEATAAPTLTEAIGKPGVIPAASASERTAHEAAMRGGNTESRWGIQISGLFLSAGGNLVDCRYRVVDPAKAAFLTKPEIKPELIDHTSGAKLMIPSSPKVGPMRQTIKQPVAGKIYFMLFANTRHHVKSGDKVSISAGDFNVEDLVVE